MMSTGKAMGCLCVLRLVDQGEVGRVVDLAISAGKPRRISQEEMPEHADGVGDVHAAVLVAVSGELDSFALVGNSTRIAVHAVASGDIRRVVDAVSVAIGGAAERHFHGGEPQRE